MFKSVSKELTAQQQVLKVVSLSLFIFSVLMTIIFTVTSQFEADVASPIVATLMPVTAIFYLGILLFYKYVNSHHLSLLIIFQLTAALTLVAALSRGVHDPAARGFFILIPIAALLLGERSLLQTAAVGGVILSGLFVAEAVGAIPTQATLTSSFMALISLIMTLSITAVMLKLLTRTHNNALNKSEQLIKSLQASEEKWSSLMQYSPNYIFALDLDNRVSAFNHPNGNIPHIIGQPIFSFFDTTYHEKIRRLLKTVHQSQTAVRFEAAGNHPEQQIFEVQAGPIQADDERTGIILIASDITERREIERAVTNYAEKLAHSNRDLEEFAYIASHDLQEPLRLITSYMGLLKRGAVDKLDEEEKEYVEIAINGAKRMRQLINSLLKYSRLGTQRAANEPVDVTAVVEQTLYYLEFAIEDAEAKVFYDPLPTIIGDEEQIGQLFHNLISNAIKFCDHSAPAVTIDAVRDGNDYRFAVRDNGIGIKPKQFKKIFAIFQRLHAEDDYPGTGVGLAICKRIVEQHNGRIWVESTPGEGSTFYFTLTAGGNIAPAQ